MDKKAKEAARMKRIKQLAVGAATAAATAAFTAAVHQGARHVKRKNQQKMQRQQEPPQQQQPRQPTYSDPIRAPTKVDAFGRKMPGQDDMPRYNPFEDDAEPESLAMVARGHSTSAPISKKRMGGERIGHQKRSHS
jgi:hypothetical protein